MRLTSIVVAAALAMSVQTAFAENAPDTQEELDIKEVVRVDPAPYDACGIVENTMIYKNSAGEIKELKYRIWGNGCSGG